VVKTIKTKQKITKRKTVIIVGSVISLVVLISIGVWIFQFTQRKSVTSTTKNKLPISSSLPTIDPSASPSVTAQERRKLVCDWMKAYRVGDPFTSFGVDSDYDVLPDSIEKIYGTDSSKQDVNGDEMFDSDSIMFGIDPIKAGKLKLDSDNDGLLDNQECARDVDPFNSDTDGDGFKDGDEVARSCDPLVPGDGKGSDCNQPVSMPTSVSNASPVAEVNDATVGVASPTPITTIPYIDPKTLRVIKDDSKAAIKTYLAAVDKNSPDDLPKGSTLPTALANALVGDTTEMQKIRVRIQDYIKSLKAISVPEIALQHHQLLLGVTMFIDQQLGAIQTAEKSGDDATAYAASTSFGSVLPKYLTTLQQLRGNLEVLSQDTDTSDF